MLRQRCLECTLEFNTADGLQERCPSCLAWQKAGIAAAMLAVEEEEPEPRMWSKAWLRERLGVTGNVDE